MKAAAMLAFLGKESELVNGFLNPASIYAGGHHSDFSP